MEEMTLWCKHNGKGEDRFAYGPDWVGMAFYMDDIKGYATIEEAKANPIKE